MNEDKIVALLYILMRDEIPVGTMAQIFLEHIIKLNGVKPVFTNKYLEAYARELIQSFKEN